MCVPDPNFLHESFSLVQVMFTPNFNFPGHLEVPLGVLMDMNQLPFSPGTIMQRITHDKYLGDIISSDGSNNLNIQSRVSKGQGLITQIMNILEKVTLGSHYFQVAMLLRESIFMNGILTNAEVWYGLSAKQVGQLESVDKLLLRKLLNTPVSTPSEGMQLELGILSINTVIKARRINFLHYLLNTSENEMLSKVFRSQLVQPV